jgi:hypothetical protein
MKLWKNQIVVMWQIWVWEPKSKLLDFPEP